MVKNKTGGKRSKGLARKQQHDPAAEQLHRGNVRTREDAVKETKGLPGEYYYAKVVRSHGNCRFAALCDDGVERMASCLHFAKKNRRDNNIEVGAFLLVGVADYHTANGSKKAQPCQILELYSPVEAACIPYFQDDDKDEEEDKVDAFMAAETAPSLDFDDI